MLQTLESGTYFGQSIQLHDHEGLSVVETTYPPNLRIPPHEHENPFFCFVVSGQATREWPMRAGAESPMDLTLFPAAVPHANCWCALGGSALHIEFSDSWAKRLGTHSALLRRPQDFSTGSPTWIARRMVSESRRKDTARSLIIEGLVLELIATCARTQQPRTERVAPRWMKRVLDRIDEHAAVPTPLSELADESGVSADHLARVFRQQYGCTVGEFIRRRRIDFACHALEHGQQSLSEIALAAGFADHSHFSREFRRHLGYTPTEYRAQFLPCRNHSNTRRNRSS